MAAQKQKNFQQKFVTFLNAYYPNTHLIKAFNSQMEDYHKIEKQEALGNYFCLKMIPKLTLQ